MVVRRKEVIRFQSPSYARLFRESRDGGEGADLIPQLVFLNLPTLGSSPSPKL